MSVRLSTEGWWLIAFGATVVYTAAMYWCMPTSKARLRMFAAPLAGWLFLLPNATVKGYSVPHTLYIYSGVLLTFVVMLAPIARKVAADIREQEEKPWDKVPLNTFSLYWMIGSGTACTGAGACFWEYLAHG
ncbi:hypothetical protein PV415_36270 [Streptomyces sp. ME03-5684b]|uniref:hypothetical protein n=1 Tax=Streptomyces sp. ME03-5684b TaxID=3028681 RepID=UPI0029A82729|nr:hypothetical protein [Streptomyces sp. ME03-5684b]MDX3322358.1 hypothetical protein [Streptomyces sp. ME03-5684b]